MRININYLPYLKFKTCTVAEIGINKITDVSISGYILIKSMW